MRAGRRPGQPANQFQRYGQGLNLLTQFKKIIFNVIILIVAGVVGTGLSLPDSVLRSLIGSLPVPAHYQDQAIEVKHHIHDEAVYLADDALYWFKSIYFGVTRLTDTGHGQVVIIELEPVRDKAPAGEAPPPAPAMPEQNADEPAMETAAAEPPEVVEATETASDQVAPPAEPAMPAPAVPIKLAPEEAATDMTAASAPPPEPEIAPAPPVEPAPLVEAAAEEAAPLPEPEAAVPETAPDQVAEVETGQSTEQAALPATMVPTDSVAARAEADAEHKRGMLYYKGVSVPKDYMTAYDWFQRAASKGHPGSQYNLGIMSYLGQGVIQNFAEAAKWFRMAGERDHAAAQYNLGFLYYEGKGVEKDDLQAYMWIDRAANLGDTKAIRDRETLRKVLPEEIFNQ